MKNSGVEWIGEIPDEWEVSKIFWLIDFINGYAFEGSSLSLDLDVPVIRIGNITDNRIDYESCLLYKEDKMLEEYSPYEGDILIAMSGATTGKIGIATNRKAYINQRVGIIRSVYNFFLKYHFQLLAFEEYIRLLSAGSAQSNISMKQIQDFIIPLPPKETQQRIASYLDKKCSKIEETTQNQQQVIEKLKAYKQSLITEAVTGKVKIANGKVCGEYESYKDSGVEYLGKIPLDWNIKRLRYIGKCQNGISKGGEFFGSGYPFVSYGDVYNNLVLPETVSGLIESTHEEQKNYSVKAGDIFFTRTSETIEEVGFTSVCLKTIENATFAGFVIRVRPFTDELIPDYSKYYFSSDAHRRFFVKEMNLVTRASLSQDLLKRLPVLIPSKEKQKEIADYLDKKCKAIDTAIEQKQKLIVKLTEYKKSLIYECVTGKKEI